MTALAPARRLGRPCWTAKPGYNLEGPWPSANERCSARFATLTEALRACEQQDKCNGITRDGGLECPIEGGEFGSLRSDGGTMRFQYETRSLPAKKWRGTGITSWVRTDGAGCVPVEEAVLRANAMAPERDDPECPVRTAQYTDVGTSGSWEKDQAAAAARRLAWLEERSANELLELDDALERTGQCASKATEASAADKIRPPSCSSSLPLIAQLALLPVAALAPGAPCTRQCTLAHDSLSFKDGWGAQHFRRASVFLSAELLDCNYNHQPIADFNQPSSRHGVHRTKAESFFRLSDVQRCPTNPAHSPINCNGPFGTNPVAVQPLRTTHALAARCNLTVAAFIARCECECYPCMPWGADQPYPVWVSV